jgi:ABC-type nitrate/sulfonate/bicarbonate transport system substrate-binding protein
LPHRTAGGALGRELAEHQRWAKDYRVIPRLSVFLLLVTLLLGCTPPAPPNAPTGPSPTVGQPRKPTAPVAVAPAPSPSPSPSAVPLKEASIRLGREAPSASHWQLFVAEKKGFLQKYALNVQTSEGTGNALIEGLASATYDMVSVAAEATIGAVEKGANFKIVAGQLNRATYSLLVGRDIGGYPELKGKPLGVGDLKSGRTVLLEKLLAANDLPEGAYSLLSLGSIGSPVAGIANGTVAGGLMDQPRDFQMMDQRFRSLGMTGDVVPDYQAEALIVTIDWTKVNEEGLVRFLKAIVEADAWLYEPKNKTEAAGILAEYTRATPDAGLKSYELLIEKKQALSRGGEVNVAGLRTVIDFMGDLELLRQPLPGAEKYVDTSFLEKAKR